MNGRVWAQFAPPHAGGPHGAYRPHFVPASPLCPSRCGQSSLPQFAQHMTIIKKHLALRGEARTALPCQIIANKTQSQNKDHRAYDGTRYGDLMSRFEFEGLGQIGLSFQRRCANPRKDHCGQPHDGWRRAWPRARIRRICGRRQGRTESETALGRFISSFQRSSSAFVGAREGCGPEMNGPVSRQVVSPSHAREIEWRRGE
jgi:hypothetical protein